MHGPNPNSVQRQIHDIRFSEFFPPTRVLSGTNLNSSVHRYYMAMFNTVQCRYAATATLSSGHHRAILAQLNAKAYRTLWPTHDFTHHNKTPP